MLFVTTALVAASAGLAFAAGPTMAAAQSPTTADHASVAVDGYQQTTTTETVNVTTNYALAPDDPGHVTVELVVENPQVVDRVGFDLQREGFPEVSSVTPTNFEQDYSGEWYVTDGAQSASLEYRVDLASHGLSVYDGSWALLRQQEPTPVHETTTGVAARTAYEHVPAGEGLDHGDFVLLGQATVHSKQTEHAPVRLVVPQGVELESPPDRILNATAYAANVTEVGEVDRPTTLYAIPSDADTELPAWALDQSAAVKADEPVLSPSSPWIQEYVHTTDATLDYSAEHAAPDRNLTWSMIWFTEGYAGYAEARYALDRGYTDHGAFSERLDDGLHQANDRNLSNYDDWGHDPYSSANYKKGALVVAHVDRQIRLASEGQNSFQDVAAQMYADDGKVSVDEFVQFVENAGNRTVANRTEAWVLNETTPPEAWSLSEHQSVYGPVPNYTVSATGTDALSESGARGVGGDEVVVTPNESLAVGLEVTNDGDADGWYRYTAYSDGVGGTYVHAVGQVNASSTTKDRVTDRFPEGENYYFQPHFDDVFLAVTAVDRENLVSADGDNTTAATKELFPERTGEFTLVADGTDTTVTVESDDGQQVLQNTTGDDHLLGVDASRLETETNYSVTFGTGSDATTQWLGRTTVEPVNGTTPRDLDGDGLYMDMDGDGVLEEEDANEHFQHRNEPSMQNHTWSFDYTRNGRIDVADPVELYDQATS